MLEENLPVSIDPRGEIKGRTNQMVAYTKDSCHPMEALAICGGRDIHYKPKSESVPPRSKVLHKQ
jgi:hypothetical protein